MMMLLVYLAIAFMWMVQIVFFERNFIESTASEIREKLEPLLEELEENRSFDKNMMTSLSRSVNGKMMIIDGDGRLIALYSAGHELNGDSMAAMEKVLGYLKESEEYGALLKGVSYNRVLKNRSDLIALEIGIPIEYENRRSAVVFYETLDQLHRVLQMNRNQLILLSIVLTILTAALAALLAAHFVKPVKEIRISVDQLAGGDLTASPRVRLHDELGQLSRSVADLSKELRRVDVLRKEVIANVSHELRAPLSLISGYGELIRDIDWKDDEKRNKDLELIIRESRRMSEMVDDILDYSQLQAGYYRLNRDKYNLRELAESEISRRELETVEYGIEIQLDSYADDIPVYVDALKICQVLRNLLNNGVNHTPDGGLIRVVISKRGASAHVAVINPGEPISAEDYELIWEKYHRSQHHGGRNKGTGIGLSIVKTILDAHGLPYGVSCDGGLTEFWFEYVP